MSAYCGCYYTILNVWERQYLPLVLTEAHTTILANASHTVLKQTYTNPTKDNIQKCTYTFPLYDGVSVAKFTCRIGQKTLHGIVHEKAKAKAIFDDAVSKGQTAGLLEQSREAADVFSTSLGNIPAGETIVIEIEYVGELKQDADGDGGIRFTIPTRIAPRYGAGPSLPSGTPLTEGSGIKITVDANLPKESPIRKIASPSHPIEVSMGVTSRDTEATPSLNQASATLALGESALGKDFVIIVQAKDTGIPQAFLEVNPDIPHHRAIMTTLVPKFSLPPERPEIVFVCDRSGSMAGNSNTMLIAAMKVFLKSLPVGVKFNICSYGSTHSFLWDKSQSYTKESLNHANAHVDTFQANFGGTETLRAIKSTVERRYGDVPLEIIVLTDGDIWDQSSAFAYVTEQVLATKGAVRLFPLGIGNGVSSSLIEGLARAGNGFSQQVQSGERIDTRAVRMLRGALSPHVWDYTLEVKYEEEDDDFELVDKVSDGMKVLDIGDEHAAKKVRTTKIPISLFDANAEPDKVGKDWEEDRFAGLPDIPSPKLLQAPHRIPSLFAFSRTNVYLLMSPDTIQKNPKSVVLRGSSSHGPLELEIAIEQLPTPGKMIHQLAARKAVQDFEENRGWIFDAKNEKNETLKTLYPSKFDDMVEREGIRIGTKFQIANKWCSFAAVQDSELGEEEQSEISSEGNLNTPIHLPSPSTGDLGPEKYKSLSHLVLQADCRFVSRSSADDRLLDQKKREYDRGVATGSAGGGGLISLVSPRSKRNMASHSSGFRGGKRGSSSSQNVQLDSRQSISSGGNAFMDTEAEVDDEDEDMGFGSFDSRPSPPRKVGSEVSSSRRSYDIVQIDAGDGTMISVPVDPEESKRPKRKVNAGASGRMSSIRQRSSALDQAQEKSDNPAPTDSAATRARLSGAFGGAPMKPQPTGFNPGTQSLFGSTLPPPPPGGVQDFSSYALPPPPPPPGGAQGFFSSAAPPPARGPNPFTSSPFQAPPISGGTLGGAPPAPAPAAAFGIQQPSLFAPRPMAAAPGTSHSMSTAQDQAAPFIGYNYKRFKSDKGSFASTDTPQVDYSALTDANRVAQLLDCQEFEGYWNVSSQLAGLVGLAEHKLTGKGNVEVTALVIAFLQTIMKGERDVWEMVVEKASEWLQTQLDGDEEKANEVVMKAKKEWGW